jgi:hypothetical protein
VEWATTLAVQFRTEGQTDELIKGVADLDHKLRAQARETTVPGSRSSPRKPATVAAPVDSDSESNVSWSPSPPRGDEEEEDENRGRSASRELLRVVRGRSLSPRLYELVGRAFIQYAR